MHEQSLNPGDGFGIGKAVELSSVTHSNSDVLPHSNWKLSDGEVTELAIQLHDIVSKLLSQQFRW